MRLTSSASGRGTLSGLTLDRSDNLPSCRSQMLLSARGSMLPDPCAARFTHFRKSFTMHILDDGIPALSHHSATCVKPSFRNDIRGLGIALARRERRREVLDAPRLIVPGNGDIHV